jgi:amidase
MRNISSQEPFMDHLDLTRATLDDCRHAMDAGTLTSLDLVRHALQRIEAVDRSGPTLRSVIETNPDAETIAAELDRERREHGPRSPLHGMPILLKDNINTADGMGTTAGSLALEGSKPRQDATIAARLRAAGAVLLGKSNMSEWANFRSTRSTSGWSGRGGQARNPYVLDRSPCGSSSGSPAATAAGIVAISIGTETDGSILCPANACNVVGIKPTVGLTSRAGVVPISASQDTVGPFARSVRDAASVLTVIAGEDDRDEATRRTGRPAPIDYTRGLDPEGLRGARIGIPRAEYFGYSTHADAVAEEAIAVLRAAGAELIDPADLPSAAELRKSDAEMLVLLYEFKAGLNEYLGSLGSDAPIHNLDELIAFNTAHADREMPYFGQELLLMAQEKGDLTEHEYVTARAECERLGRTEGIDAVMDEHRLDALMMPTGSPSFLIDLVNGDAHGGGSSSRPAAIAGYPAITVPAGYALGIPVGITFMGRAWSEESLIRYAYAFEAATHAWRPPEFLPTTPSLT